MPEVAELTSIPPITFLSTGADLSDWTVTGAAGGVGKVGTNLLNLREVPEGELSNGQGGSVTCSYILAGNVPGGTGKTGIDYNKWTWVYADYTRDDLAKDARIASYATSQWFAHLPPGDYKLIMEGFNGPGDGWLPCYRTVNDETPYLKLFTENDTELVSDMDPFENFEGRERWIQKIYEFTVTSELNAGLFTKIYPHNAAMTYRYMIVPADTPMQQFTNTEYIAGPITGETCWEPYKIYLPLRISSVGGGTTEINIPLTGPMQAGTTVSLASTGITIPTYYGRNTLSCDTDVQPVVYIKYTELEPVEMWAEGRPAQVNVYDITEPQSGYNHNGVAVLMPSEIISNKEDKGRWDLDLIHPIDEYGKWTYIVGQNVIKVNGQLFRIDMTQIDVDKDGEYVTAHAKHITYDMNDYWIEEAEFTASGGENYITQLNANRVHDFPNQQHIVGEYVFDITSDIVKEMQCQIQDQSVIEAIFGADNSMVSRYGGEVYRNNFHLSVNESMEGAPEGNAFSIRYGSDMTRISFRIDFTGWVTNLICVDNFGNMAALWYGANDWIIHHHKTKRVHFTYSDHAENMAYMYDGAAWGTEMTDDLARLITDMYSYWDTVSTPSVSVEVAVAKIKDDPKYKDFLNLQNFDVGYKGTIYVEHLGINVEMKIVSIRRNELTGEAIQIVLGNTRRSLIRQTVMSGTICSPNSVEGKNTLNAQSLQEELYTTQTSLMAESINGMELFSIAELERRTINELEG